MILRLRYWTNLNLIRLISRSKYPFPEILEKDLEENFVHGWGPGGSKVNKGRNCVSLKHIPTGIFVKVFESRSLDENREIARERLVEKVDLHLNGEKSYLSQLVEDSKDKLAKSDNKRRKKREKNAQFRELVKKWNEEETRSHDVPS